MNKEVGGGCGKLYGVGVVAAWHCQGNLIGLERWRGGEVER